MYFLTTTADELEAGRSEAIERIVDRADKTMPFGRYELMGQGVLGYYITSRRFVARVALAVFPSNEKGQRAEIVTGSLCDWRAPDAGRLGLLAYDLVLRPVQESEIVSDDRLRNFYFAQETGVLPESIYDDVGAMEAVCAARNWPSVVLALETVDDDGPENRKPELATMYSPLFTRPLLSQYSLQSALDRTL